MSMVDYVGRSRKRVLAGDIPTWVLNRGVSARYIASVIRSAPPWVDRWELYALKHTAAALTKMTGVLHVLDHIVPLNHPNVCGLTVPWNLRIVTWRVNGSKGGKWNPDQMELFEGVYLAVAKCDDRNPCVCSSPQPASTGHCGNDSSPTARSQHTTTDVGPGRAVRSVATVTVASTCGFQACSVE